MSNPGPQKSAPSSSRGVPLLTPVKTDSQESGAGASSAGSRPKTARPSRQIYDPRAKFQAKQQSSTESNPPQPVLATLTPTPALLKPAAAPILAPVLEPIPSSAKPSTIPAQKPTKGPTPNPRKQQQPAAPPAAPPKPSPAELAAIAEAEAQAKREKERKEAEEKAERERLEKEKKEREEKEREEKLKREEEARQKAALAAAEEQARARRELRQENLEAEDNRPDETDLKALDSSLKRNSGYVKKLKNLSAETEQALINELGKLNLTKYVSEAVQAVAEAKLKMSDVPAAIQVCSALHRNYSDFAPDLLTTLVKAVRQLTTEISTALAGLPPVYSSPVQAVSGFTMEGSTSPRPTPSSVQASAVQPTAPVAVVAGSAGLPGAKASDILALMTQSVQVSAQPQASTASTAAATESTLSEISSKATRRKVLVKFLIELFVAGIHADLAVILQLFAEMITKDSFKDPAYSTASAVSALLRLYVEELSGIKPRKTDPKALPVITDCLLTPPQQKEFANLFNQYYDLLQKHLVSEYKVLKAHEQENQRTMFARGDLTDELRSSYEKARKQYEKVLSVAQSVADVLNRDVELPQEDDSATRVSADDENQAVIVDTKMRTSDDASGESPFDDEDARAFYETIPNIRDFVPAVLLGPDGGKSGGGDVAPTPTPQTPTPPSAPTPVAAGSSTPTTTTTPSAESEKEKEKAEDGDKETKSAIPSQMDDMLSRLPKCCSRTLIDEWAVQFCYLNTKSNRRKLVKTLFAAPRTQLELLPHYSRLVATLNPVFKDIAPALVQLLEEEFNELFKQKNQLNIESKIKNIRFLGELTKFKVASPSIVLHILSRCLDDFTHHNVDVACHLLETCGRFLYKCKETNVRTANLLATMMRLKTNKVFDPRYDTMIENAYFMSKPPERSARTQREIPPLHQYIRHLMFTELTKKTAEKVVRQLRKLPWKEDPTIQQQILYCLRKAAKAKFSTIHLVACVASGLKRYHPGLIISLLDSLLEDVRCGLQYGSGSGNVTGHLFGYVNPKLTPQRRISDMKFLGELYNYTLFGSKHIFTVLYQILFFNVQGDAPDDYFRVRLACTLLDTVCPCFDSAKAQERLREFIPYFQLYLLYKQYQSSVYVAVNAQQPTPTAGGGGGGSEKKTLSVFSSNSLIPGVQLPSTGLATLGVIPLVPIPLDVDFMVTETLEIVEQALAISQTPTIQTTSSKNSFSSAFPWPPSYAHAFDSITSNLALKGPNPFFTATKISGSSPLPNPGNSENQFRDIREITGLFYPVDGRACPIVTKSGFVDAYEDFASDEESSETTSQPSTKPITILKPSTSTSSTQISTSTHNHHHANVIASDAAQKTEEGETSGDLNVSKVGLEKSPKISGGKAEDEEFEGQEENESESDGESYSHESGGSESGEDSYEEEEDLIILQDPTQGPSKEEEDEFEKELQKMVQDSVDQRRHDRPNVSGDAMELPLGVINKQRQFASSVDRDVDMNSVRFTFLTKKGSKPAARDLAIPVDNSLVAHVRQVELEQMREKEEMKRIILQSENVERMRLEAEEEEARRKAMSQRRAPKPVLFSTTARRGGKR